MNFGVLTDSEMEKFMLPEAEEQCLLVFHDSTDSMIPNPFTCIT